MHYIVLDLEWNQANSREEIVREPIKLRGEIVQIGAVKLDESFRTVDTFKIMVFPLHYKIMNYKIVELTGIHTSDIKRGYTFPTAYGLFKQWIGDDAVILTWGCDDIPMLSDNMLLHGIDPETLPDHYDLQPIFDAQITKEHRQHSLTFAMERLGEPPFEAHDALNDALSTAAVCRHLDMEEGFRIYGDLTRSTKVAKIDKTFQRFSDVLYDEDVKSFVCRECRSIIKAGFWESCRRGKLIALIDCECGEKYMATLHCFKSKETGEYYVTRRLGARDEGDEAYYEKKRLQNEEWRKKRAERMLTHA